MEWPHLNAGCSDGSPSFEIVFTPGVSAELGMESGPCPR